MPKPTNKERLELLRERLKGNPQALAELDFWAYQNASDWWKDKLDQRAGKIAAINKHFLRG
jgi:hypothetical protein